MAGLGIMLMGLGFLGFNAWSIETKGRYYGSFFLLGFASAFLGLFAIITGRSEPPPSFGLPPPPLWWRVAGVVIALAGVGVGIYVSETLKR